jgi:tight adherence protein B
MLAAATTFIVCLAIFLGIYFAFVVMPEDQATRRLRKRLKPESPDTPSRGDLARRVPKLSALKSLDTLIGKSGRLADPLRRTVEQSGLSVTIGMVVLTTVFATFAGYVIVSMLTPLTWLSVVAGLAFGAIPFFYVRHAATRRLRQFEDQFPQAMDLIASSLRAGHAFTTGVSMVGDEVPDPTGAEFRLLYDQQNFGMPLPEALKSFARRVPLLDARFFITAVLTQREAGGNLAEVLDNLSTLIRERSRVKRQVRVASAHGRITGWVLSLMPPMLAGIMLMVAPDTMQDFAADPIGVRMIIVALVLQVVGTLAIRRIINVEF